MRRCDRRKIPLGDRRKERLDRLAADELDYHDRRHHRLAEMSAQRAIVMLVARRIGRSGTFVARICRRVIGVVAAGGVIVCASDSELLSCRRMVVRMSHRADDAIDRL
jgi:hypothetical protein